MVAFNKFFSSVFLAVCYASTASAIPFSPSAKFTTHHTREISPSLKIETYHPESSYETFGAGIDHPLSRTANTSIEDSTVAFIKSHLSLDESTFKFRTGYAGEAAKHAYVKQVHAGIPFANAVANVAFSNDNKVVAFGNSFVKPTSVADSTPKLTVKDAIAKAESLLPGKYNDWPARLEYFVKKDNTAVLTHIVQIRDEAKGTWYEAFIDAHSGELVSVTDFVAKASYLALQSNKEYPTEGFTTITNPADTTASPNGWHNTGSGDSTDTSGNNVISYKGSTSGTTKQSATGLVFNYVQAASSSPTTTVNVKAATVNNFYVVNSVHDWTYRYGFTESAYNFQQNNNGKGGAGNDRVTASIQDSAGTDNADFATPGDGQSGHMRMFLWDFTSPNRDGALENDIVIHENTHGVTNRMTGGGTGACLQTTESGGMGEGWSDAMADWAWQKSATIADFDLGVYVYTQNIRSHPYSTSATTNPLRYSSIAGQNEVHNIGEIWANILHNVHAALTSALGFDANAKTNPAGTNGNNVFMHLFLDALALQPCNPTFVTGRDAWIQADVNRYGGANKCTLWRAFASRGLGSGAVSGKYVDSTTVPSGC
jgi:extracellular elastinolytic metalloproteinase